MKANLIPINLFLSFSFLTMDTERAPLWAVAAAVVWFALSIFLLIRADRRGEMDGLKNILEKLEKKLFKQL
jgi:hypothetical protein